MPAYGHQVVVKERTMLSKDTEQLMLKRRFWKEFLKAIKGGELQGAWSAHAQFWLVDGEVTECVTGINIINP